RMASLLVRFGSSSPNTQCPQNCPAPPRTANLLSLLFIEKIKDAVINVHPLDLLQLAQNHQSISRHGSTSAPILTPFSSISDSSNSSGEFSQDQPSPLAGVAG